MIRIEVVGVATVVPEVLISSTRKGSSIPAKQFGITVVLPLTSVTDTLPAPITRIAADGEANLASRPPSAERVVIADPIKVTGCPSGSRDKVGVFIPIGFIFSPADDLAVRVIC